MRILNHTNSIGRISVLWPISKERAKSREKAISMANRKIIFFQICPLSFFPTESFWFWAILQIDEVNNENQLNKNQYKFLFMLNYIQIHLQTTTTPTFLKMDKKILKKSYLSRVARKDLNERFNLECTSFTSQLWDHKKAGLIRKRTK